MTITISGSIGGSPDGNPEHGGPIPVPEQKFNTIEDALVFIRKMIIESNSGQLLDMNMNGTLTINWSDQEQ